MFTLKQINFMVIVRAVIFLQLILNSLPNQYTEPANQSEHISGGGIIFKKIQV